MVGSYPYRGQLHNLLRLIPSSFIFLAFVSGIVFLYCFSVCSLLVYRKATDFYKLIFYPATFAEDVYGV
jgi:hypothetical protein